MWLSCICLLAMHTLICHFFSFSWCRGLAAASACGSSWTFLFTFLLHIPRSHPAYFDRAFSIQGPKVWNSLSADIRNSTSINRLKSELKRYLLYNNKNALKFGCISNRSSATGRCGAAVVFGRKLDRPWLSLLALQTDT